MSPRTRHTHMRACLCFPESRAVRADVRQRGCSLFTQRGSLLSTRAPLVDKRTHYQPPMSSYCVIHTRARARSHTLRTQTDSNKNTDTKHRDRHIDIHAQGHRMSLNVAIDIKKLLQLI